MSFVMASCCKLPLVSGYLTLGGETLRRAPQFVLAVLLITSLGAPAAICCQHCVKETANQKTAPSPSDQCSHHMSHVALGRTLEAVTHRSACHACSRASRSSSSTLITPNPTPGPAPAEGKAKGERVVLLTALRRLPESPPPLMSNSKQAFICTFLI